MNIIVSSFNFTTQVPLQVLREFEVNYCQIIHLKNLKVNLPTVKEFVCTDLDKAYWAQYPVDWNDITPLDEELISQMRECETIVYKMMDSLEPTYFLAYYERKLFYYRHLRYWNHILATRKIDLFLSDCVPHGMYDWVIYCLCKLKNIATVMLHQSSMSGVMFVLEDWEKSAVELVDRYQALTHQDPAMVQLGPWYQYLYDQQTAKSADPVPFYMKTNPLYMKEFLPLRAEQGRVLSPAYNSARSTTSSIPATHSVQGEGSTQPLFNLKRLLRQLKQAYQQRFDSDTKQRLQRELEQKQRQEAATSAALAYERQLFDFYEQHTVTPDLTQPYIYVAFHYQPESSTCPTAGAFVDQLLIVQLLAAAVPPGVYLYVKEHPSQRRLCRDLFFYQDLAAIRNVCLIPRDFNTFRLIDHALAVATATGTAGWEGLFRSKPVLMFGHFFYQYAPGVFSIRSLADCRAAMGQILAKENQPSPGQMKLFLKAVEEVAVLGYLENVYREDVTISRQESLRNIAQALIQRIKQLQADGKIRVNHEKLPESVLT